MIRLGSTIGVRVLQIGAKPAWTLKNVLRIIRPYSMNKSFLVSKLSACSQNVVETSACNPCSVRVIPCQGSRFFSDGNREFDDEKTREKKKITVLFVSALGILVLSLSYAAVPLYRLFCQAYSYGGTLQQKEDGADIESMTKREDRKLRISFNADTAASLTWNFKPQQSEITVAPGETALAFYTATNNTDRPIDGIATYNVIPFEVGQYFNKIQCFCFEEQRLNPGEQVDMPVFFYIDPEFADDPKMETIHDITLSYTFFEAKEGLDLPMPKFGKS